MIGWDIEIQSVEKEVPIKIGREKWGNEKLPEEKKDGRGVNKKLLGGKRTQLGKENNRRSERNGN